MLRELHIANLAVIEDVTVELAEGLNCFTGQTGAGKSLILGAFEHLLGLKTGGADLIRPGADEARVSGLFEIHGAWLAGELGRVADQPIEPGEQLLITRKFFATGRSSISVNGRPATAAMVRQIGELLVDVHGQHDHQYLLKPSNQLHILDAFGKCADLRDRFAAAFAERRDLLRRGEELAASRTLRRQQLELYEFQAGELDAARLQPGEYAELKSRHVVLSNVQRIKKEASAAHAALYDSEGAILERLAMAVHVLGDLAELDESLRDTADAVKNAAASLQDAAYDLGRYVDRLDLDPAELAEIEDRLNLLNRLVSKYTDIPGNVSGGDDPVQALIQHRERVEKQIAELRGQNEDMAGAQERAAALKKELTEVGGKLTAARTAAAAKLRPLVEAQLHELGMAGAAFEVQIVPGSEDETGGVTGMDVIEMLVRTNPGQPARPLRKIASGGELSRIMLALKSILAQADRVSVLVFDEIDANIGGRMGTVIGEKLRGLTRGGAASRAVPASRAVSARSSSAKKPTARADTARLAAGGGQQVICITHLPQIAAFADRHLRIAKSVAGKGSDQQTRTTVTTLTGDERITELAEMLAGKEVTKTTHQQARELLAAADA